MSLEFCSISALLPAGGTTEIGCAPEMGEASGTASRGAWPPQHKRDEQHVTGAATTSRSSKPSGVASRTASGSTGGASEGGGKGMGGGAGEPTHTPPPDGPASWRGGAEMGLRVCENTVPLARDVSENTGGGSENTGGCTYQTKRRSRSRCSQSQ